MTIKAEAFIALETSLSLRLSSTLQAVTSELYANVQKLLKDKNWDGAERLMRGLDLAPVFDLNEPYIAYLSQMSVLFGASRVTATPGTSAVGLGFEKATVRLMMDSFRASIVVRLQDAVITSALQLIALARDRDAPDWKPAESYLASILKGDKPSALLPFASFMDKQGKAMFDVASSLHTSRLSAFGFTSEAGYLGITEYQINEQLDGRTCQVCELMHGKVFKVSDARNLLDIVIRTEDSNELKSLQPWPGQSKDAISAMSELSSDELVSRGWHVPPFHPKCRGLLSKSGKAPKRTPGTTPKPAPEAYVSSAEDFHQLGINLSPAKVDLWNTLMKTSPAEVVANLSGITQDQLLASILGKEDPQSILGLANLSVTKTGVNLELQKPVFGSKNPVAQDYYFRKDQTLFVGSIELSAGDEKLFKNTMKALYRTAKDTAMTSLKVVTDNWVGGYSWAKLGFTMTERQWGLVKSQILASPSKLALIGKAPVLEQKAMAAILGSVDPKSIYALADLPTLGKPLLLDTAWQGSLPFDDPEAMTRFLSMLGAV